MWRRRDDEIADFRWTLLDEIDQLDYYRLERYADEHDCSRAEAFERLINDLRAALDYMEGKLRERFSEDARDCAWDIELKAKLIQEVVERCGDGTSDRGDSPCPVG